MFAALVSYITGRVRIRVRGLNLDRLLQALLKEGLVLMNLKRPSYQMLVFDVSARSEKRAAALIKKQGYEYEPVKRSGLPGAAVRLAPRIGLIAGLILCAAGIAVYNAYVRDIRIEGIERIAESDVTALLSDMGVKSGSSKRSIDNDQLAVTLNTKLEDAASVTVQLKGTSLIIRIYETLYREETPDANEPRNIVSQYDAIITKVVALNGTPYVSAGDIVRKGEILIAGYSLDAEGNMTEVRAEGEVTGKVFFTADNVFFTEREEYVRTGNSSESVSLKTLGVALGGKKDESPYPLYEKEVSEQTAFKNLFIPVRLVRVTYYELAAQTSAYDYEKYREGIESAVKAAAEAKVPKGAAVVAAKTDTRQIDKYVITMYNIEAVVLLH